MDWHDGHDGHDGPKPYSILRVDSLRCPSSEHRLHGHDVRREQIKRTCMQTHACKHKQRACMHTRARTHMHKHTNTHRPATRAHKCMSCTHAHGYARSHSCIPLYACTHVRSIQLASRYTHTRTFNTTCITHMHACKHFLSEAILTKACDGETKRRVVAAAMAATITIVLFASSRGHRGRLRRPKKRRFMKRRRKPGRRSAGFTRAHHPPRHHCRGRLRRLRRSRALLL